MIKELEKKQEGSSNVEIGALIERIVPQFENAMNNNLDVKTAFDNLYENIQKLFRMREMFTVKDSKDLLDKLHRIDSVLQCLF
jgi:hypothetical protein